MKRGYTELVKWIKVLATEMPWCLLELCDCSIIFVYKWLKNITYVILEQGKILPVKKNITKIVLD